MRPTSGKGRGNRDPRAARSRRMESRQPRAPQPATKTPKKATKKLSKPKPWQPKRKPLRAALTWLGFARPTPTHATPATAPQRKKTTRQQPRRPAVKRSRAGKLLTLGNPDRRLSFSLLAVCLVLALLGGRLVQLQAVNGSKYANAAQEDRVRTYALPAERGEILDRDGNVLAYTLESKLIFADPSKVTDSVLTAQLLAPLLGKSFDEVYAALRSEGRYVVLARKVSLTDAQKIADLALPGIGDQDEQQRLFPNSVTAANVIGFTDRDGNGQGGIEQSLNTELAGKAGSRIVEVGKRSEIIPAGINRIQEPVPGKNVQLTLSGDIQFAAQNALNQAVQGSGAKNGQVVVLDAHTAEVLAMASSPTYDPTDPGKSSAKLLGNPAVSSVFEPGSANKVVTFSAAVEAGLINPETVFNVPGQIKVADRIVHDAWVHGNINFTATGILAKSSNVGTLLIAQKLGQQRFYDYLRKFGVGTRTGIELPAESPGLLPDISQWSGSTFGNLPIGQGLSVTTLQLASMYQAVANDGKRIEPRIVQSINNAPPRGVTAPRSTQVISPQTAKTVRTMLEAVNQKGGTAPTAAIDGYRIAGKTGTAQQPDSHCHCYTSRFWSTYAGIASSDNPDVVIAVMIDQPRHPVQNMPAAPYVFKQIASYALQQRGTVPTGTPPATYPLVGD